MRLSLWRSRLARDDGVDYVVLVPVADVARWVAVFAANRIAVRVVGSTVAPPPHCVDKSDPTKYGTLNYYAGSYHALAAYTLTEYERVAVVDTDALVRRSDVFELLPDGYSAAASLDWPNPSMLCSRTAGAYYQLGIFLLRPNATAPALIRDFMTAKRTHCKLALQDGLNAFWRVNRTRVMCLPAQFNCQIPHHLMEGGNCLTPDVRFIHFSGHVKPWLDWLRHNLDAVRTGWVREFNQLYAEWVAAHPYVRVP